MASGRHQEIEYLLPFPAVSPEGPASPTSTYGVVREFSGPAEGDEKDPLDTLTEAASANLGSYQQLTRDARWRVRDAWARPTAVAAGVVGEPQEA